MRIVTLEEHYIFADLAEQVDREAIARRGMPLPGSAAAAAAPRKLLADLGADRLADMDASGISVQVLSQSGPGADLLEPAKAIPLAKSFNDRLAAVIRQQPDRYAGFAHLPMAAPDAAADELERSVRELGFKGAMVNGIAADGRFLDDPTYEVLLSRAEALDVPIYIHPGYPPKAVREAYYDRLPVGSGNLLALAAWGWHQEVAIHTLRLVFSGALDRHRKLQIIIGHMGEGLPAMMDRCDAVMSRLPSNPLTRTVSRTILDQVWITTSGFFSLAPFTAALMTFGADRIMFSVDYPFSRHKDGRIFLDGLPVSHDDRRKIAHANADALLKL